VWYGPAGPGIEFFFCKVQRWLDEAIPPARRGLSALLPAADIRTINTEAVGRRIHLGKLRSALLARANGKSGNWFIARRLGACQGGAHNIRRDGGPAEALGVGLLDRAGQEQARTEPDPLSSSLVGFSATGGEEDRPIVVARCRGT